MEAITANSPLNVDHNRNIYAGRGDVTPTKYCLSSIIAMLEVEWALASPLCVILARAIPIASLHNLTAFFTIFLTLIDDF